MRTRTKMKKDAGTAEAAKPVYRLTDMIIEEVSAVDRAANKRQFLVVKNASGEVAPGEVVQTASGELTVAKAPEAPTASSPESQAAPTSPEAPAVPSATNPENAPLGTVLRLAPETKADLAARVTSATALLTKLAAAIDSAEVVQGLAEIPQEVIEGVASIVSALDTGVTKAAVEKGRKQISMARESKIRAAHSALGEIVAELDAVVPAVEGDAVAAEPAAAAPSSATTKSATPDQRDVVLSKLVSLVERQNVAITKQAARLDAFERGRPVSNAGVVDATRPSTVTKADDEQWPLDMNAGARKGASADGDFTSR